MWGRIGSTPVDEVEHVRSALSPGRWSCFDPAGTLVWVIEQRGRFLWTRLGKSRAQGRTQQTEHPSDDAARAALAEVVAARMAEGFVLVDAAATVSVPLLSSRDRARALSRPHEARLTPTEIQDRLMDALRARADAGGMDLAAATEAFFAVTSLPCTFRTGGFALLATVDRSAFALYWDLCKGEGYERDDYDFERCGVRLTLASTPPAGDLGDLEKVVSGAEESTDELEEVVALDLFIDDLWRVGPQTVWKEFKRVVEQEDAWIAAKGAQVTAFDELTEE